MKALLLEKTKKFLRGNSKFERVLFCNNGVKQAIFERKLKNYITCKVIQYKGHNIYPETVLSIGTCFDSDILYEIENELNILPTKPIVLYRANKKLNSKN